MSTGPVAVDFETYYDRECSIAILGDAYFRHPRYNCYLVSIVGDEGEEFVGHPFDFDWDCLVDRELWSHNAGFDRRVYYYLRWQNPTLPDLETPLWRCTANLSVFHRAGRSLKAAVSALLGVEITKDVRDAMMGKTPEDMRQSPPLAPGFANLYDEVCAYAISDSRLCRQLAVEYGPSWPETERALADITTRSCHTGLPLDLDRLETGIRLLETKIWETDNALPWVAEGYKPTSPKGLAEWCRRAGIPHPPSTAVDDERAEAWETVYGADYPWVGLIRERRKANTLIKRARVLLEFSHDGWFSYQMKYGGAHTLRWSGGSRE